MVRRCSVAHDPDAARVSPLFMSGPLAPAYANADGLTDALSGAIGT